MNIILEISQIEIKNIMFLETKKNIIIDGNFTKLIYADNNVSVNGIFITFPILASGMDKLMNKNILTFQMSTGSNSSIVKQVSDFENRLIEYYKCEYGIQKKAAPTLMNQLSTSRIKLYKETDDVNNNKSHPKVVLKISGIWETVNEVGITYKFLEMHTM